MKASSNKIRTTNTSIDDITYEQFLESDYAKTVIGRLYIALLAEVAWSSDYKVYINLHKCSSFGYYLQISHKDFPYSRNVVVKENESVTIEDVEKLIGEKCKQWAEDIRLSEEELRRKRDVINAFGDKIFDAKHTHLIRQKTGYTGHLTHHRKALGMVWPGEQHEDWQAYYSEIGSSENGGVYFCNLLTGQVKFTKGYGFQLLTNCSTSYGKGDGTFGWLVDRATEVVEKPSVDLKFIETVDEVLRK